MESGAVCFVCGAHQLVMDSDVDEMNPSLNCRECNSYLGRLSDLRHDLGQDPEPSDVAS